MFTSQEKYKMTLRNWQNFVKEEKEFIVQASSMNEDDAWKSWSIGYCYPFVPVYDAKGGEVLQKGEHNQLYLCAVRPHTDRIRRPFGINRDLILENLKKNNIHNSSYDWTSYMLSLPNSKFVISPEGNGIDCHRHYEALMAGCIPILEKNVLTEEKYKGCPIVWTIDYSDITPKCLEDLWNDMLDKTYDFSALMLSSYDEETQQQIRISGNYWLSRLGQRAWY